MITDWKIAKSNLTCYATGTKFNPGDAFCSVLLDNGAHFERRDYCLDWFQENRPENVFSFWKSTVPVEDDEEERKPVLDLASVLDFFRRLAAEHDAQRVAFRYVLALMLARKKVLRLKGGRKNDRGEDVLVFTEGRGGEEHEVVQPPLDESEIVAVSEELGRLLGLRPPQKAGDAGQAEASNEQTTAAGEVPIDEDRTNLEVHPAGLAESAD